MEQLQNSVHNECEIQFANSRCKLGSRSTRMVFVEPAAWEDRSHKFFHTFTTATNRRQNR